MAILTETAYAVFIPEIVLREAQQYAARYLRGIPYRPTVGAGCEPEAHTGERRATIRLNLGIELNAQGYWDHVPTIAIVVDLVAHPARLDDRLRAAIDDAITPMIGAW